MLPSCALTAAGVSYLITGFVQNWLISLPVAVVMMLGVLLILRVVTGRKTA